MASFLGINASRLEKVEERLKFDVINEAKTMGGLILVHQELGKYINSCGTWKVILTHFPYSR
jgi:hypothetical protein